MTNWSDDPLRDAALAEVTACIGCNDCMLACPLPQAKTVTIAELNAGVLETTITNPSVIDFVTACTQCRQCVPACPADLSRADMVLYNKTKVEDAVPDHPLVVQVGANVYESPWTLDGLTNQLGQLPLFAGVEPKHVRRLLLTVTLRQLQPGEHVCRAGEFHERLLLILYGALEQYSDSADGQQVVIVGYGPGSFLGEMGVLADQPEPFSVRATAITGIIEIPKASVRRMMQRSDTFQAIMEELYRRRALWTYARSPEGLGSLPEAATEQLLKRAELDLVRQGQFVFRQGEAPRDMYLVKSGFFKASKTTTAGERTLVYFREGEVFGALGLLLGERAQSYSVMASTRAEVIRIPGAALHELAHQFPATRDALTEALSGERVARSPALGAAPMQDASSHQTHAMPLSAEALFDAGLAKGREVLVIDQTKCTYCQNCIDACERRHGHSRLELRGLQLDQFLFPTACRHCNDPVCLLCSVNGIVRRPSGEISIVDDNCIGCGACASRCPYGNISMHPAEDKSQGFFFSLFELLAGKNRRDAALQALDPNVPQRAVKCDLCAEYSDYACVTACPTGAAFRTDLSDVALNLSGPARSSLVPSQGGQP